MAKNASVGGLNFRIGADSSALAAGLSKAEKEVEASHRRTTESARTAARTNQRVLIEAAKTGAAANAARTGATKNVAEAANKFATAGGVSALAPVAALGQLGPAALGAGAALSLVAGAARLASTAFEDFRDDPTKNATKLTAAGEAIDNFKKGVNDAASELASGAIGAASKLSAFSPITLLNKAIRGEKIDFSDPISDIEADQQRGRDLDRANAAMFKKSMERKAAQEAAAALNKKAFDSMRESVMKFATGLRGSDFVRALEGLAKPPPIDFDAEPIAKAIISTNRAEMATYGSEAALEILDNKRLAEEQKQSRLLAEIAKSVATPKLTVMEF